ncbi:kinase-like domain, phloem protein 2-like protein, partial [Tanacetum coccineum]
ENHKDNLKLSLKDIKLATQNFNQDNLIGHGDFGNVYKGVAAHTLGQNNIAAKRLNRKSGQGEAEFLTELDILLEYKHDNVIGLLGYCDEEDEKIIVYQYASRGSLDRYLSDDSLTWVMRLKICIDIVIGLEFLHGIVSSPEMVIHRDISSSNILLFDDWKAKITDFGLSLVCPTNQDVVIDNVTGTIGYCDPLYSKTGFLTKESDIFSLGAVLFDILCGKLSSEKLDDEYLYLPFLAKQHYHVEKLDELVFEGIKEQIVPQSYTTFTRIALHCLHHMRERRPMAGEVIIQLKKALEFQMSKCPEKYSIIKKEDLYNIFSEGILLQQDKVLLSFVGNGERFEMVSATMFSYINSCPHDWKSLPESRFEAVLDILDISDLNFEVKTRAQFLSPDVIYGVYLVFKFCDSKNFSSKPMYVNLRYRNGHKNLHAYFATWRDEQWMMIELHRFLNQNEDVVFEFLFERFSSYYSGDVAVYVEGIEFRPIEKDVFNISKSGTCHLCQASSKQNVRPADTTELIEKKESPTTKHSRPKSRIPENGENVRFEKVAEMSDISNLNIEIKTDTQLLSSRNIYGVYLVFKLCDSRKFSTKLMYVNLKYRKGSETLQAYFATQRDKNWMMIELYRFLNLNEDVIFKFLLESFSSYDCGYGAINVEGIEFRAIDKVKHDDMGYLKEVQEVLKSKFNVDQVQQLPTEEIFKIHNYHDELFWLGELNGKKFLVLSAKEALYKITNVDLFTSKPSTKLRDGT